ncbi:MAG: hypothetical protein EOP20_06080 [Hyphomicrobiales bacterium]|nr:MAG: hypothetical protein EOP20_06080 [Hyphomicrobiales bacterium]
MRRLMACLVISLAALWPAFAFDSETAAALERLKIGKLAPISAVQTLMRNSERWCYIEDEGSCSWSDVYLEVTDTEATYEIGNAWDANYDVLFTDRGAFKDDRYICETGYDWVPTLRAINRSDRSLVEGRQLWSLKTEIGDGRDQTIDCFDYVYRGSDPEAETVTLLQRQFTDGVTDPSNDTTVTVHFNAATAAALTWYY